MGWVRERGIRKCCLSSIMTLLRKAGEELWNHVSMIVLYCIAFSKGHNLRLHYVHHVDTVLKQLLQIK